MASIDPRIQDSLTARRLSIHRHSPKGELVFEDLSTEEEEAFYGALKQYSTRLLLREIIKRQEGFTPDMLGGFSGEKGRERTLDFMRELGIVQREGNDFYLTKRPIRSFGPTLEWFVAELMEREFASPAAWGIRFKGVESGGDFDVISSFEDQLVYIEVKSAPPKGIEVSEVAAFLHRINSLLPRTALFFVDTHLRMRDRVVLLFHQRFLESLHDPFPRRFDIQNLERELFHVDHRIFILNSARDVVKNFHVCLRDFLKQGLQAI
jgi:hypothetical protein